MKIVFLDSFLIVIDKPVGIAAEAAVALLRVQYPGYLEAVHRIDQPVSGLMVLARTKEAAAHLNAQLAARTMERRYIAVCEQLPSKPDSGLETVLTHHLRFDPQAVKMRIADDRGTLARLHYRVVGATDRYPVLLVTLETGRRHQIRAQLAAARAPVVGDLKYGARRSRRGGGICLHALEVTFCHPLTDAKMTVHAPVEPTDPLLYAAYLLAADGTIDTTTDGAASTVASGAGVAGSRAATNAPV